MTPARTSSPSSVSRRVALGGAASLAGGLALAPSAAASSPIKTARAAVPTFPTALRHAHAHNDYAHPRPLIDALSQGFPSAEADVFLIDGELRLGHIRLETRPGHTLTSAYLEPLAQIIRQRGSVLPGLDEPFQLLIDLKTGGGETYAAIEAELAKYAWMMTEYRDGVVIPRHVTAVLSGGRPLSLIAARRQRFAFADGSPGDQGRYPTSLVPLISEQWSSMFWWQGVTPMPAPEVAKLTAFVASCHAGGHRVRFYGTPDLALPSRDRLWAQLRACGVDWLNTDDLVGLRRFLLTQPTA